MSIAPQSRSLASCSQLKAARALAGWTQADLGYAIGVNERQIRFWEKRLPTNSKKRRLIEKAFSAEGIHFFSSPTIGYGVRVHDE